MKKTLLLSLILMVAGSLFAQVAREYVLVEIGTGTGCVYCPGAALGLDDLYVNGDPVAGIEYHSYNSSDPFNTPEAAARTSYYGITGYPTAQFDGEYAEHVGGDPSNSLYSTYLPFVNARSVIQSQFTVELYGDNTGNSYDVVVRVTKESEYSGTDLKVRFALTESNVPYNWYGLTDIDFAERLMAPDENGTAVSFANVGDQVDVNLSFTFNSSWVASNCELVAWIQDDANKFVLQTTKVELLSLQPDVASANFTQNVETTCEGSSVSFTDLSGGNITSWNWVFEGGIPATSTDQNPVVTYNTVGDYDVSLEVSDGTTTSTMALSNLIHIILPPVQPNAPTGEISVCANSTYTYSAQAVPVADTYTWKVEPVAAGIITGTGTQGTFTSDGSFVGDYTISVRADNFCGNGIWSSPLSCTLNYTPQPFSLSDGGGICAGSQGLEITQSGSETGIDYLLYCEGNYTGTTLAGTGNALNFGFQNQEGIYTVMAHATHCDLQMWGTPWIHVLPIPSQASIPTGSTAVCNDQQSSYSTTSLTNAESYNWLLVPAEAGELTVVGTDVDIAWASTFSGEALLSVAGENQCGVGTYSDELAIQLSDVPHPEIAGPVMTCDFTAEIYTAPDQYNHIYEWVVQGGTITSGDETNQITVMWSNPGVGTVNLTQTSPEDCSGVAEEIVVTIDNCTAIETNALGELKIYPNPVDKVLNISLVLNNENKAVISVLNVFGQVVASENVLLSTNGTFLQINTAELSNGYYIVKVETTHGVVLQQKFVKQ
ncbi:MAG: T9SS type A sorting domain-containing protein [Bacteroidales bacterium]|nr:T9SS type A sorting domain-containing protein [Bacteroidales bacterium]